MHAHCFHERLEPNRTRSMSKKKTAADSVLNKHTHGAHGIVQDHRRPPSADAHQRNSRHSPHPLSISTPSFVVYPRDACPNCARCSTSLVRDFSPRQAVCISSQKLSSAKRHVEATSLTPSLQMRSCIIDPYATRRLCQGWILRYPFIARRCHGTVIAERVAHGNDLLNFVLKRLRRPHIAKCNRITMRSFDPIVHLMRHESPLLTRQRDPAKADTKSFLGPHSRYSNLFLSRIVRESVASEPVHHSDHLAYQSRHASPRIRTGNNYCCSDSKTQDHSKRVFAECGKLLGTQSP